MAGLSTIEKQLVADNSDRWVTINKRHTNVEDFWNNSKENEQEMKLLLEAIRKQLDMNNKIMAGTLSDVDEKLITDHSHRWVTINGKEHKVEDFKNNNKEDAQQMKLLVEAIGRLALSAFAFEGLKGVGAKSVKTRNASLKSASPGRATTASN